MSKIKHIRQVFYFGIIAIVSFYVGCYCGNMFLSWLFDNVVK